MCRGCWVGTYGAPIISSDDVLVTAELIRRLYEDLGCSTGGPLHWMLDDMNIDDEQFENVDIDKLCAYLFDGSFERYARAGDDTSDERKNAIKETCALILHAFRGMPESHRAAAIAWHEGWIAATFANLTDVLENAGSLPRAIPELTELLVADWTREMNVPPPQPGEAKACVPIPCPPFTGQASGTVYPGPGRKFAPDAKITGPGVIGAEVNADGSANITWQPPSGVADLYASLLAAPDTISIAPTAFDPDCRIILAPPYPPARCSIGLPHLPHPWPFVNPAHWCDAQPLPDVEPS